MATYTVKSGETLSKIGAKLGVDWRQITGFRSGDPNLIYPGEVLTIPGAVEPKAKPFVPPTTPEGIAAADVATLAGLTAPAPSIIADDLTTQVSPVDIPVVGDTDIPIVGDTIIDTIADTTKDIKDTKEEDDTVKTLIEQLKEDFEPPVTKAPLYEKAAEEAGIAELKEVALAREEEEEIAQSTFNRISAEITTLVNQTKQRQLQITKEPISAGAIRGRNITEERRLAIQVLPLQSEGLMAAANLASAQGKTRLAQSKLDEAVKTLDKVFEMQYNDQENLRNYNNDLRAMVYDAATAKQKEELDLQEKEDENNFELMKDNIDFAQSIAKDLLQTQPNLAAKIAQIDWSKPNATQKLSNLMGQVEPEVLAGDVADIIAARGKITPDQLSPLAYAVYAGTIKLTDITPSQRAEIAPELTAVGYTATITSEMKQAVTYIKNQMPNVLDKWRAIPNNLKGVVQGWLAEKAGVGLWNAKVAEFNAAAKIVGMQLTRLYEKGRISDQDRIFYLSIMPNIRMNEEAATAGSDELIRLLEEKLTNQINELEQPIGAEGDGLSDEEAWALYNKMNQ